jgi:uncharacterized BrkB/YihY/UPF0761 family membrane protein
VLVWGYYCAQIFLFGAAITTAFAQRFGSRRDAAGAAGERKLEKEVEKKPEPKAKNDAFPIALPNPRIL